MWFWYLRMLDSVTTHSHWRIISLSLQLVGFALLGLGLWLRFSINTRGIFEMDFLNSNAFVIGEFVFYTYLYHKKKEAWRHFCFLYCTYVFSVRRVSLSSIRCDSSNCFGYSDADCGGIWRLWCLQWKKVCPPSGKVPPLHIRFQQSFLVRIYELWTRMRLKLLMQVTSFL